jgi:3-oxoacyl-[acyl-carrier protein] reductase
MSGSSGVGSATAKALAASHARVVVADGDLGRATDVTAAITHGGGVASAVGAALSSEREIASIIAAAVEQFGGLDILVNIPPAPSERLRAADGPIVDLDPDLFDEMLNDQLVSFAMAVKHAVRHLPSGGVIVNLAHVAGMQAHVSEPMLGSSRTVLNREMASRWTMRSNVTVCCHGLVDTPTSPT